MTSTQKEKLNRTSVVLFASSEEDSDDICVSARPKIAGLGDLVEEIEEVLKEDLSEKNT